MGALKLFALGVVALAGVFVPIHGASAQSAGGITATTMSPTTGLNGGETIAVEVSGLAAGEQFRVGLCVGTSPSTCYGPGYMADPDGTLTVQWEDLRAWTYLVAPFGDSPIRSCRAPGECALVAWTGEREDFTGLSAIPLTFTGHQTTATFTPIIGLVDGQQVTVTGKAEGAGGRTVEVRERACFTIIQATGCDVDQVIGLGQAAPDGSFSFSVAVRRVPPRTFGGVFDCADPPLALSRECEIRVWVQESDGQLDQSFGSASAPLAFAAEPPPTVRVGDISVREGTGGRRPAIVPVTLSRPMAMPVTVLLKTLNGTAKAPADFTGWAPSVIFQPGQTVSASWIMLKTDAVDEPDERFVVQGTSVSGGGSFSKPSAWVTIRDDD